MSGRILIIGLLLIAAVAGAGLWYAQVYAYYQPVEGVASVRIGGAEVAVSDYRGLDGQSSPLKLRGCFTVDPALVTGPAPRKATPLIAPGWFDCFDAEAIGLALEQGAARAVVAEAAPQGFERIVAVFPDGRAYQWRQVIEE